ncbi:MAG: hypothetical protein H6607_08950 [Flavobacteriales bacterium]|nr:hypothetical protein [Flavobacteriales bacterium]
MQLELGMYRTTKGFKTNHKSTELICENCESAFLANRKNARFCSSSCRSQFWLNKNDKKVITLAVPIDMDDDYLEEVKAMLLNYKKGDVITIGKPQKTESVVEQPREKISLLRKESMIFDDVVDLRMYLESNGFEDYKVPKMDNGIYYDEGLTIKKIDEGWETLISKKVS